MSKESYPTELASLNPDYATLNIHHRRKTRDSGDARRKSL